MKFTVVQTPPLQSRSDLTVYFSRQTGKKKKPVCADKEVTAMVGRAFAAGDFCGKEGETFLYYPADDGKTKAARVLVVGLGKEKPSRESVRKAAGVVASFATKNKAAKLVLVVPELTGMGSDEVGECLAEGVVLGGYRFLKYKTKQDDEKPGQIKGVAFAVGKSQAAAVRRGVKLGQVAATAVCAARDMATEPGNFWTPSHFAEYGREPGQDLQLFV